MAIGLELPIAFLLLQPLNSRLELPIADFAVTAVCELLSGTGLFLGLNLSGDFCVMSLLCLLYLGDSSSGCLDTGLGLVRRKATTLLNGLDGCSAASRRLLPNDAPSHALYTVVDEIFYLCFPSV